MSKNKITRWIDFQNQKLCFSIASVYYRKREGGKSKNYIFNIRFLIKFLLRLLIVFLNFFRFNKNLYHPYLEAYKLKKYNIRELFNVFAGLNYFTKSKYQSKYYDQVLNFNELEFINYPEPLVSIIIPIHNQISFTINCLKSIYLNVSKKYAYEIIIIDDCSTDNSFEKLIEIPNINIIQNIKNIGFLNSCNKACDYAKGDFICFLNNDTIVLENWLESLVETIINNTSIGAVGSKLIYPYGLLQEAGGIAFADSTVIQYGKFQNIANYKFNYAREVDYCSGASLLIRKNDFLALNKFDSIYSPAYFEDTDLCFSIRNILNKKVVYQPLSVAVHYEGTSSGKNPSQNNTKKFLLINKVKFSNKWQKYFSERDIMQNFDLAAKKYLSKNKILVIDTYLPIYDKESGSNRLMQLLKIFLELDYNVIFVPNNGQKIEPYYSELISIGIEVLLRNSGRNTFYNDIKEITKSANIAWVCRPELNKKFKNILKSNTRLKWIYDTVDLHYIRLERAYALYPDNINLKKQYLKYKTLELKLAKQADAVVCITEDEKMELHTKGINNLHVVQNIHDSKNLLSKRFGEREGIIFIGSYNHHPNVDAVHWLVNEIMPLVWKKIPHMHLTLLGNNPPKEVSSLNSDHISVTGFLPDVSKYFENAKIFVAPLRYGAGMKGKIGQSLEYHLPIISTTIGIEGMGFEDGKNVIIANESVDFAHKICNLYENENQWNYMQANLLDVLNNLGKDAALLKVKNIIHI